MLFYGDGLAISLVVLLVENMFFAVSNFLFYSLAGTFCWTFLILGLKG
jgi:hypothetical protein